EQSRNTAIVVQQDVGGRNLVAGHVHRRSAVLEVEFVAEDQIGAEGQLAAGLDVDLAGNVRCRGRSQQRTGGKVKVGDRVAGQRAAADVGEVEVRHRIGRREAERLIIDAEVRRQQRPAVEQSRNTAIV